MNFLDSRARADWGYYFICLFFLLFCLAFYFPLSSKAVNNIFYAGLAFPTLLWVLLKPRALYGLKPFTWLFLLLWAMVFVDAGDLSNIKKGLYLSLFFCALLWIEKRALVRKLFFLFSISSLLILAFITIKWLFNWFELGAWIRQDRFLGAYLHPGHAALLIVCGLIFTWCFYLEKYCEKSSRGLLLVGIFGLSALVLLCSTVFQSRTALAGFAIFLVAYFWRKKLFLSGVLLLGLLVILVFASGADELLMRRGFSYRLVIWEAAWDRLWTECGILLGCGADDHMLLGKFHHPHNGFLAMLYRNGIPGALLFLAFTFLFVWKGWRSPWFLVALFGWGALLTESNGVLTTPQPLWVYFWLPTFMAILDGSREEAARYFVLRQQITPKKAS